MTSSRKPLRFRSEARMQESDAIVGSIAGSRPIAACNTADRRHCTVRLPGTKLRRGTRNKKGSGSAMADTVQQPTRHGAARSM